MVQWTTPGDAIRLLRAGMRIFVGSASGTPSDLLAALADSGIEDVELFYFVLGDFDIEAMLARAPLVKHRPLYVGRRFVPVAAGRSRQLRADLAAAGRKVGL